LIDACFSASHGVANILLNHADINIMAMDDEGRTALCHLCGASLVTKVTPPGESEDYHKKARQQLLTRMLDNGADPNHKPLRDIPLYWRRYIVKSRNLQLYYWMRVQISTKSIRYMDIRR